MSEGGQVSHPPLTLPPPDDQRIGVDFHARGEHRGLRIYLTRETTLLHVEASFRVSFVFSREDDSVVGQGLLREKTERAHTHSVARALRKSSLKTS